MKLSKPLLGLLLWRRSKKGKEDIPRLGERKGVPGKQRPEGTLVWVHAASVGEAQSSLALIEALLNKNKDLHVLVTTGTVTSAKLMKQRLPERCIHQYYPLDTPDWTENFLDHWIPDAVIWMESELWPNMCRGIRARGIPAVIANARMSEKSFNRWKKVPATVNKILDTFEIVFAQSEVDEEYYKTLGAKNTQTIDNLKYAAAALPSDKKTYKNLSEAIKGRLVWLYASTHEGEEALACRLHGHLKKKFPDVLTIIVPRHPDRRNKIKGICRRHGLTPCLRTEKHQLPEKEDDIYIADTLGEMGLFYRVSPIACIGRSFSNDGGGGHNPIEAAQLGCAVLHGPHVQNLALIYKDFDDAGAAIKLNNEEEFQDRLIKIFEDEEGLSALQNKAETFVREKAKCLDVIVKHVQNRLVQNNKTPEKIRECA